MKQTFTVTRNGSVIGTITAIINPDLSYKEYNVGLCGYYDCIDDPEVARDLFAQVNAFHKAHGTTFIIGPMNDSTWGSYRITEPPFNPPFFLDNTSKPWYSQQFIENGFHVIERYLSTKIPKTPRDYQRLEKFERLFAEKVIHIRSFNLNAFETDLKHIYDISIKSFVQNVLYTPISFDSFSAMYVKIKDFINPEYVLIAEHEGNPMGFIFGVDNIHDTCEKTLVLKTLAVVPDARCRGLGTVLVETLHRKAFQGEYQSIIHALMHQSNSSTHILSKEAAVYQQYSLFGKHLG
jgi:N-acetylglutamate synthase-like GNAT family acetyltransferase